MTDQQRRLYNEIVTGAINARRIVESDEFKQGCSPEMYQVALRAQKHMDIFVLPFVKALENDDDDAGDPGDQDTKDTATRAGANGDDA